MACSRGKKKQLYWLEYQNAGLRDEIIFKENIISLYKKIYI